MRYQYNHGKQIQVATDSAHKWDGKEYIPYLYLDEHTVVIQAGHLKNLIQQYKHIYIAFYVNIKLIVYDKGTI